MGRLFRQAFRVIGYRQLQTAVLVLVLPLSGSLTGSTNRWCSKALSWRSWKRSRLPAILLRGPGTTFGGWSRVKMHHGGRRYIEEWNRLPTSPPSDCNPFYVSWIASCPASYSTRIKILSQQLGPLCSFIGPFIGIVVEIFVFGFLILRAPWGKKKRAKNRFFGQNSGILSPHCMTFCKKDPCGP